MRRMRFHFDKIPHKPWHWGRRLIVVGRRWSWALLLAVFLPPMLRPHVFRPKFRGPWPRSWAIDVAWLSLQVAAGLLRHDGKPGVLDEFPEAGQ